MGNIARPPHTPAVVYHPDAARAWLRDGAAKQFGIDDDFTTVELSIAGGLQDLLTALDDGTEPQVWTTRPPLHGVQVWRTADGDGVDGGVVIAAEVRIADQTVLLATGHLAHDEFVDDEATSGINAAVKALGHIADLINREIAALTLPTTPPRPHRYTVVGVWRNDRPIPVGVIAGEHDVDHGDEHAFPQGLWATSVTAPDSAAAQHLAVAEMRAS